MHVVREAETERCLQNMYNWCQQKLIGGGGGDPSRGICLCRGAGRDGFGGGDGIVP